MLRRLFLILVLLPLADLALLMFVSTKLGWQATLASVVAAGIFAVWLFRSSYRGVLRKLQQTSQNELPLNLNLPLGLLSDGAMVFLAAGLLLTPGFLSDAIGITILIPACRRWYRAKMVAWFKNNMPLEIKHGFPGSTDRDVASDYVDGEIVRSESQKPVKDQYPRRLDNAP